MYSKQEFRNLVSCDIFRPTPAILIIVFVLTVVLTQSGQSQTFKVLYNFTGGTDGHNPYAGLTMDRAGNLYGTTLGAFGSGTVFRLVRSGSGWAFTTLYAFKGFDDGARPYARVIFGPDGSLYGTTYTGGVQDYGTVYNLRPPATACKTTPCPWTETVLYRFSGGSDGCHPLAEVAFDHAGNLYGTTSVCGAYGNGTVYELIPSASGWTERTLYSFTGGPDGGIPFAEIIFDEGGNLYSTTYGGGDNGYGTVFQMTRSGSGWTEKVLYSFHGIDGAYPSAGLVFDQSGNLYGTTWAGWGSGGYGTVFELTPSDGSWTESVLYSFPGDGEPVAHLTWDAAGNLYTSAMHGVGAGNVFKLTPSTGGWNYTSLHDFNGASDGDLLYGSVIIDANGNLYGTAYWGGDLRYCNGGGCGVVWEVMP